MFVDFFSENLSGPKLEFTTGESGRGDAQRRGGAGRVGAGPDTGEYLRPGDN